MLINFKTKHESWIIGFMIVLYIIAAASVSLHRYWQYDAFWYDFGIFDETIWKWSRFQLPIITNLAAPYGKIVWADHFNPSAILLAPFYWLTNKTEIILIAQSLFVGVSAFVGYLIARKIINNHYARLALIISYLGFVGMQNALYTDVHNIVYAVLPLMLSIWSIYFQKWRFYWICLLLTLGFQENMAAVGIGLGLFLILKKPALIKYGLITIFISLLWAFAATKIIIPYFNHGRYLYLPDYPPVWWEWISRFFLPADLKLRTQIMTFLTFGLLPLGSVATWPLIIEHYLERFVLNSAATRWDLGFHYNALLSPIMFLGALDIIQKIQKKSWSKIFLSVWGIFTICMVFFLHRFYLHGPLMLATHPVFYEQTERNKFIDNFAEQIPKKGLLMTQNNLATHFTHGNTMLLQKDYQLVSPDYIALDLRPGQNPNNFYPFSEAATQSLKSRLDQDVNYVKKEYTDSQLIYRKRTIEF